MPTSANSLPATLPFTLVVYGRNAWVHHLRLDDDVGPAVEEVGVLEVVVVGGGLGGGLKCPTTIVTVLPFLALPPLGLWLITMPSLACLVTSWVCFETVNPALVSAVTAADSESP